MKFTALQRHHMRQAIRAYLPIAYPHGVPDKVEVPTLEPRRNETLHDMVRRVFRDESSVTRRDPADHTCTRLTLRLGNDRYPNMKLVLQEFVEQGEFVFGVDAHDQLPINPSMPGYDEWQRLRDYNAWVKHRIERRFDYLGLPTLHQIAEDLVNECGSIDETRPARILVADDDPDLGQARVSILRKEGYQVFRAHDGQEALDMMEGVAPDLVVMDFLMPRLCGGEVCARLKRNERFRHIPVLLATTTPIELVGAHQADGFMVKPFHRKVLLSLVQHLLGSKVEGVATVATA